MLFDFVAAILKTHSFYLPRNQTLDSSFVSYLSAGASPWHCASDACRAVHFDSFCVESVLAFLKERYYFFYRLPRDPRRPEVSAASVFAKTTRDAQVCAWCDDNPALDECYAIRANKGYLSARHVQGLRAHGLSSLHRASYRVRALEDKNMDA